jgi:hypothetical protein
MIGRKKAQMTQKMNNDQTKAAGVEPRMNTNGRESRTAEFLTTDFTDAHG